MEVANSSKLKVTRRVVINKIFEGSQWSKLDKKWIKKEGFKQIFFGSMIGVFKHQIPDELFLESGVEVGKEFEVTYTLREYTDSKFNDYRCSISDISKLKPIS